MIIKYLPLAALLFLCSLSLAQNPANETNNGNKEIALAGTSDLSFSQLAITPSLSPVLPYNGGGSNSYKNFCLSVNVGLDNITGAINNIDATTTPGSVGSQVAAGLSIQKEGKKDGYKNVISIMLSTTAIKSKLEYKDKLNNVVKLNYSLSSVGLPVSYTSIMCGRSDVGFFWQGGLDLEYCYRAKDNGKNVSAEFNKIFASPFASLGLTFPLKESDRSGWHFKAEQVMIGPYVSYVANNMSALSGGTLNCLTYGLRLYVMQVE